MAYAQHLIAVGWQRRDGRPGAHRAGLDLIGQGGHSGIWLAQHEHIGWGQAAHVHAPTAVAVRVQRRMDHLGCCAAGAKGLFESTAWVDPVEHQHHIGFAQSIDGGRGHEIARWAHVLRVVGGKHRAGFQIGDHRRLQFFGQAHARLPIGFAARHAPHQDDGSLGLAEQVGCAGHVGGCRWRRHWRRVATHIRCGHQGAGFLLLQGGIEVDVDRPAWGGLGNLAAAQQGLDGRRDGAGLVVPFGVVAHQCTLVGSGVDPIDPRSAPGRVPRASGPQHQHRCAVAPGIEHRHGGVHQAHVGVHHRAHHAPRCFGIAMGNGDGHLFMQAQQHLGRVVAQMVDQAVVQTAVTGPWVQRQVGNLHVAQALGYGIAAPKFAARRTWHRQVVVGCG